MEPERGLGTCRIQRQMTTYNIRVLHLSHPDDKPRTLHDLDVEILFVFMPSLPSICPQLLMGAQGKSGVLVQGLGRSHPSEESF